MKGCSWLADLITALFLLLTVGAITLVVILVANPRSSLNPLPPLTLPASMFIATDIPTATASPTATPGPATATPLPPTVTQTPLPTITPTPTPLPPPSKTPVISVRASATPRVTAAGNRTVTAPPIAPPTQTPSGFQFSAQPVRYDANKTGEGCKYSSIAGAVNDAAGNPVRGIAISVQGGGGTIDETQYSGQERRFGEGGFEVFLGSQPRVDDYTLTVLGKTGAPLSEAIKVRTRTGCTENVAIVIFVQTR